MSAWYAVVALSIGFMTLVVIRVWFVSDARATLVEYELRFPRQLAVEAVQRFLAGWSGSLPPAWKRWAIGVPPLIIETRARPNAIKHYLLILIADDQWEHRWFIEVDRATEHRPTILRKAADYISYWQSGVEQSTADVFPQVLWVTPDQSRADRLTDWLRRLDRSSADLFEVCTDTDFKITITSTVNSSEAIE